MRAVTSFEVQAPGGRWWWQSGLVPKTPFDSDFYVVCATVIPVLFLALAVQGDAFKSLLDAALKARMTKPGDSRVRKLVAIARAKILQEVGYFIWLAGAIGECLALWVLYRDQEQPSDRLIVLWSTGFLVLMVAMGPLNAYVELRKKIDRWPISQSETQQPDDVSPDGSISVDGDSGRPNGQVVDEVRRPAFTASGLGWPEEDAKPHNDRKGLAGG